MVPELGQIALMLALCLALAQCFFGFVGAQRRDAVWMSVVRPAATAQFLFVGVAFVVLAVSFLRDDFSLRYVAENSNTALPWPYKIAAVWGAHEGSLLLWTMILAIWTVAVASFSRRLPLEFVARVLAVMGLVSIGFLTFMLSVSDPFTRLLPPPLQGRDLNPLLQDPGMVGHPPMLYMGYVGLSVAFAFAVAALLGGKMDSTWARWSKPWTIVAWLFLTLGITLGSWWSYYVLGWGGWWFWDPVENASFMPWLAATALIHSLSVTEKRGTFKSWTALLAITAFSLSLLGTFLVRSGILISVHSFASDPRRGIFVLVLIAILSGGALTLYSWRAHKLVSEQGFKPLSRETFLLLNNVVLVVAAAAILLGTLYPLIIAALGLGQISVGPPYFNSVFAPLIIPLILLMGIGPYVYWKFDNVRRLVKQLRWIVVVAIAACIVAAIAVWGQAPVFTVVGIVTGLWLLVGVAAIPVVRWRRHLPFSRGVLGMIFAHLGIAFVVLGVFVTTSLSMAKDVTLAQGGSTVLHGYRFSFDGMTQVTGPNYKGVQARIVVTRDGKPITVMYPEKLVYVEQQSDSTKAAIDPGLFHDLYVALGQPVGDNEWSMRFQYKPFVRFIWLGGLVMVLGGLLAASDRRYRKEVRVRNADLAGASLAADKN
ncbi:MAG: heme lyase CcmF/NrfE family subunit [Gammaproteobacteria bacterium]|nr:heme lyase CcmF/NrfE family subunit [Gammaproteobacteria bacterium]